MTENSTPKELPILTSKSQILYPGRRLPFRPRRKTAKVVISEAKRCQDYLIFCGVPPKGSGEDVPYFKVGTLAQVVFPKTSSGEVILVGLHRVELLGSPMPTEKGCLLSGYTFSLDEEDLSLPLQDEVCSQLRKLGKEVLDLIPAETGDFEKNITDTSSLTDLVYLIAEHLDGKILEKQELLEVTSVKQRGLMMISRLQRARESLVLQGEIRDRLTAKMTQMQKEGILREHMKAIQDELGEGENQTKLRSAIEGSEMPEATKTMAMEELKRLESMGKTSPESHLIQNYLETLVALPWAKPVTPDIDLKEAKKVLNADHFGLEKVKKRILEYLAVMHLRKGSTGTILIFVGPPGVGKTSLVKSIAKALGRPYTRMSLGGVRDDSEIRGHRRTYIGAMPGQIMENLKRVGARNPVFLLDEIDKMGHSHLGAPAHALLEALDPEQNHSFVDHYVDQPFDLSDVVFVATANDISQIPGPLRDRMEVIELSGYTPDEKLRIAKDHLVPAQVTDHGIAKEDFVIHKPGLDYLISKYTREAGVRELQRKIAGLARHVAVEKVLNDTIKTLTPKKIKGILGTEIFDHDEADEKALPGVATGLAWTPVGGEILRIESKVLPGTGKLLLTGKLGDVMKESAHISLSLVRSHYPSLSEEFAKNDIHIHVPSGATPKDGPSAGITICCSLLSYFSGKPVDQYLAMSGEVSLRGRVLPVGGIKEKLIAAHRAGIKKVLLSDKNKKDTFDLPKVVQEGLKIKYVSTIEDVFSEVFGFVDVSSLVMPSMESPVLTN